MRIAELFVELGLDTATFTRDLKTTLTRATQKAEVTVSAVVDDSQLRQFTKQVNGLKGNTVKIDADVSSAAKSIKGLEKDLAKAGKDGSSALSDGISGGMPKAGKSAGGGFSEGFGGAVSGIASKAGPIGMALTAAVGLTAGIGLAAGKLFVDQLQQGMEVNSTKINFGAATGFSEKTVTKFAEAAGASYVSAFGDSVKDNLDTAKAALQGGLLDSDATQQEISNVINQLDAVSGALGIDIPEAARAAGQMIRTGMAKDAEKAFDIILKGNQLGINASGDLLDTFAEYSTQFRKLGIDGEDALGLISQMVQAGARDTDIAADAIKEFSIRTLESFYKVGKKGKIEFNNLGIAMMESLNLRGTPEQVVKQIKGIQTTLAGGGPAAREAFGKIVKGMQGIKDPAQKAQAQVALFGTQAEDLGGALNAINPDHMYKAADATSKLMAAVNADPAAAIESAQRTISKSADDIRGSLATAFAPMIKDLGNWVSSHRAEIIGFFKNLTVGAFDFAIGIANMSAAVLKASAGITRFVGDALIKFSDLIDAALATGGAIAALDPTGLATKLFENLTSGAKTASENMRGWGNSLRDSADKQDQLSAAATTGAEKLGVLRDKFAGLADQSIGQARLTDATTTLANSITTLGTNADGTTTKFKSMKDATKALNDTTSEQHTEIKAVEDAFYAQRKAAMEQGASEKDLIQINKDHRAQLQQTFEKMGLNKEAARKLTEQYDGIPGEVKTEAKWKDTKAKSDTRSYAQYVNDQLSTKNMPDQQVLIQLSAAAKTAVQDIASAAFGAVGRIVNPVRHATGGAVQGPGTGTSDSIPALLSNNEHVVTSREVAAMGGHQAVSRWRAAALSGDLPGFAKGGSVKNYDLNVTPTVSGSAVPTASLNSAIARMVSSVGAQISTKANTVLAAAFGGSGVGTLPAGARGLTLRKGVRLDQNTMSRLLSVASRFPMHAIQGSWSHYGPSKGTHAGAGAVDLHARNWNATVKALRGAGLLAMFRNWTGNQHIHAINPNVGGLSPQAQAQVRRARANGGRFDSGGWLETGSTLAVNGTRQPEAVLTAPQWAQMERLITAVESGRGGGAPFIGHAVIRETVDLDRYERQRAFRERSIRV